MNNLSPATAAPVALPSLGQLAYETYAGAVGGKSVSGQTLPAFAELAASADKSHIARAWNRAANRVVTAQAERTIPAGLISLITLAVGHASLCWEPKPAGVFDTDEALFVAAAVALDLLRHQAQCKGNAPNSELLSNPDAVQWARAFIHTIGEVADMALNENPGDYANREAAIAAVVSDEQYMIGWFANAMCAMHDFDQRRVKLMPAEQEPKYMALDGRLVNRQSGEAIPDDEPVFILRARDVMAHSTLCAYHGTAKIRGAGDEHLRAVLLRIMQFEQWAMSHGDRMKMPDTALDDSWAACVSPGVNCSHNELTIPDTGPVTCNKCGCEMVKAGAGEARVWVPKPRNSPVVTAVMGEPYDPMKFDTVPIAENARDPVTGNPVSLTSSKEPQQEASKGGAQ